MELIILMLFIVTGVLVMQNIYTKGIDGQLYACAAFDNSYLNLEDEAYMTVKVVNKSRRFIPVIMMNVYCYRNGEYLQQQKLMFSLLKRQMVTRKIPLNYDKRGLYEIKEIQIIYRDLFLKNEFKITYHGESSLTVYPELQDVSDIRLPFHKYSGDKHSDIRINEDVFKFYGMRNYYPEDSVSKINWKASAASGKLISNIYEDSRDISISMLIIFPDEKTFLADNIIEKEISLAAGIYNYYLKNNVKISLATNAIDSITSYDVCLAAYNDESNMNIILESLARISTKKLKEKIEFSDVNREDTLIIIKSAYEVKESVKTDIDNYKNAGFDVYCIDVDG